LLPDGDTILFTAAAAANVPGRWEKARVVIQSLTTGEQRVLVSGGSAARYVGTGHLVYALGGVLFAVGFDLDRKALLGGAVPMVEK
jgi:hypothetical protein